MMATDRYINKVITGYMRSLYENRFVKKKFIFYNTERFPFKFIYICITSLTL